MIRSHFIINTVHGPGPPYSDIKKKFLGSLNLLKRRTLNKQLHYIKTRTSFVAKQKHQ